MTIELPALDSEPLIYFLFHSGVFVAALAAVFFLIGLSFGAALWARHKRRARTLAAENEELRNDIADLKRKLADFALTHTPRAAAHPRNVPDIRDAPPVVHAPSAMSALADVPAMPELAAAPVHTAPPPSAAVRRPAAPKPAPAPKLAVSARTAGRRPEAAVAPFSFLMDDVSADVPGHGPEDSGS